MGTLPSTGSRRVRPKRLGARPDSGRTRRCCVTFATSRHKYGCRWIISYERVKPASAAKPAAAAAAAVFVLACSVVASDRWISENSLAADVRYKRIWTLLNLWDTPTDGDKAASDWCLAESNVTARRWLMRSVCVSSSCITRHFFPIRYDDNTLTPYTMAVP